MKNNLDQKLNIKTEIILENETSNFNRSESTPYYALNTLFNKYKVKNGSSLIDFGSASGRVCFYVDYFFNIKTTGIEIDKNIFNIAINNLNTYSKRKNKINFINEDVRDYKIKKEDNIFYFFNPFKFNIFEKIIKNIITNSNKYNKVSDILIYYNNISYINYLNSINGIKLIDKFRIPKKLDNTQLIYIFRYKPLKIN